MIVTETVKFGKKEFKRTYSDSGFIIRKKGTSEKYSEAIDVPDNKSVYVETTEKIEDTLDTDFSWEQDIEAPYGATVQPSEYILND